MCVSGDWGTPQQAKKPPVSAKAEIGGFPQVYIHLPSLPVTLTQKSYKKIRSIFPKPVEILGVLCYHYYVSVWVRESIPFWAFSPTQIYKNLSERQLTGMLEANTILASKRSPAALFCQPFSAQFYRKPRDLVVADCVSFASAKERSPFRRDSIPADSAQTPYQQAQA